MDARIKITQIDTPPGKKFTAVASNNWYKAAISEEGELYTWYGAPCAPLAILITQPNPDRIRFSLSLSLQGNGTVGS